MKCKHCGKKFIGQSNKIYCSPNCVSLSYYYKNKNKVLKYQMDRIERLRKRNPKFRKKYNARRRASQTFSLKGASCSRCRKRKNLQRHHKDYNKPKMIKILCRACHNKK